MDNAIRLTRPGQTEGAVYEGSIRVVSAPVAAADLQAFWKADQGENIKGTSARLLHESLQVAIDDMSRTAAERESFPFKTIRYSEGSVEKIERAQVLAWGCERVLIRDLRGNLISAPPSAASATTAAICAK